MNIFHILLKNTARARAKSFFGLFILNFYVQKDPKTLVHGIHQNFRVEMVWGLNVLVFL